MPSISTWSAIGGLGGATEDLQKILAQRLAEQSQRDLVAEREAAAERARLDREALAQYRKDQQDLEERKFTETQTENRGEANERGLRLMGIETEMARKAEQARERERLLADPTTPERDKRWIRLAGQGQPPASLLEDPDAAFKAWDRERQAELGYDKDLALYQSKLKPGPSPDTPPKPSDREQAIPPELGGLLTQLWAVAPTLQTARQFLRANMARIQADFPTADPVVIDKATEDHFKSRVKKNRTELDWAKEQLGYGEPEPTYTYPGKRGAAAPATKDVTPPSVTPPTVADPALEILRRQGLVK